MIELHEGRVEANSHGAGMGSEFVVRLPFGVPGMSGYELAAKIRAGGFCPASLKLVAVTGYAKDPAALAAAGFDGHLSKPLDIEQLGETLANVIVAGVNRHAGDTRRRPSMVCRADRSLPSSQRCLAPAGGAGKRRDPRCTPEELFWQHFDMRTIVDEV